MAVDGMRNNKKTKTTTRHCEIQSTVTFYMGFMSQMNALSKPVPQEQIHFPSGVLFKRSASATSSHQFLESRHSKKTTLVNTKHQ